MTMSDEDNEMVKGFAEMERKLGFLGASARAVCRMAANRGTKFLAEAMRAAAPEAKAGRTVKGVPVAPGGMKRSIKNRGMRTTGGIVAAKAGLDVGRRKTKDLKPLDSGGHGHWYVHGTDHRYRGFKRIRYGRQNFEVVPTRKGVSKRNGYTGSAQSHLPSFIRTATQGAAPQAWRIVVVALQEGITKAIRFQGLGE